MKVMIKNSQKKKAVYAQKAVDYAKNYVDSEIKSLDKDGQFMFLITELTMKQGYGKKAADILGRYIVAPQKAEICGSIAGLVISLFFLVSGVVLIIYSSGMYELICGIGLTLGAIFFIRDNIFDLNMTISANK